MASAEHNFIKIKKETQLFDFFKQLCFVHKKGSVFLCRIHKKSCSDCTLSAIEKTKPR